MIDMIESPARAKCVICSGLNEVRFVTTLEIWQLALPQHSPGSRVCLSCFMHAGDTRGVRWEVGIELSPVSAATAALQAVSGHGPAAGQPSAVGEGTE